MIRPDEWLGLQQREPGRWAFDLTGGLCRFDDKLFGGTGLAVATSVMDGETGRAALWVDVQFVASADLGGAVECDVEELARGRRTSQVRLTATRGRGTWCSPRSAATGDPREGGLELQVDTMPEVAGADDCAPWMPRVPFPLEEGRRGWFDLIEIREVPEVDSGMALWARMRGHAQSHATLGFLADMVPSAVVRAAGRAGAGTSLDNSIRCGPDPDCEWVLVELVPHFASGGYLHGSARIWAPDGTHLAVASQTAVGLLFD